MKKIVLFLLIFMYSEGNSENLLNKDNSNLESKKGIIFNSEGKHFNIERSQIRLTENGNVELTQSIFYRLENKMFFIGILEFRENADFFKKDVNSAEWNIGGPIDAPWNENNIFGWVIKGQYTSKSDSVYSFGTQWNFSKYSLFDEFSRNHKLTMFLQFLPIKNNNLQGDWSVLFYNSLQIYKDLYIRGYIEYSKFNSKKDYIRLYQDFIYPVKNNFDIYFRIDYQNRNEIRYGIKGVESSVGIRYNFRFKI